MTAPLISSARPNASHRESDDGYRDVVAVLDDRWRVIVCKDAIQWIVQFAKKSGRGVAWRSARYVRTRDGLIAACARSMPEISPSALAILQALPEHIEGDARLARKSGAYAGGERI